MATHVLHFERHFVKAATMGDALRSAAAIADDLDSRGGYVSHVDITDIDGASGYVQYRVESHDEVDRLEAPLRR